MVTPSDLNPSDIDPLQQFVADFSAKIHRERPRKFQDARINWGRGRLASFSSQASFVAQFSSLNGLKIDDCERFFADYFGCDNAERYDEAGRYIFDDENLAALALLIDEPLVIVKTLQRHLFRLPACFGEFKFYFSEIKNSHYISYCSKCLSSGYHGAFHEVPWLYSCPIHQEPLKRKYVGGRATAYVEAIAVLLRSACPSWPDIWGGKTFPGKRSLHLLQLRRWLVTVQNRTQILCSQNLASLGEMPYSYKDIGIVLGRLETIIPVPTELINILIVPPHRQQQKIWEVPFNVASTIKIINKKFPLPFLLWFFNKYRLIVSSQPSLSSQLVAKKIMMLKEAHSVCQCQWAWDRYAGWGGVYSDEERPSWLLCPYEYAIKELEEYWLVFASNDASNQAVTKLENKFIEGCKLLLDNELGCIKNRQMSLTKCRGFSSYFLLPEVALGKEIESVLDYLLEGQAAAHCDELSAWLTSIFKDQIPVRATSAGSVNIFQSKSTAWISTWKSLEANSVDPVRRWKDGFQP